MTSSSYYYGIVQIWYNGQWGNICDDNDYGQYEADVICHQLGYTGASSYSRAGLVKYFLNFTSCIEFLFGSFGVDYNEMLLDNLDCTHSSYLTILQCSYSTHIDNGCTGSYDATVSCCKLYYYGDMLLLTVTDTTRIWDNNPYPGMIRLQGGNFVNQGRVEVYCNGQWGTICDDGFGSNDANIICKQLGYTGYTNYDHLSLYVMIENIHFILQYS